MKSKRYLTPVMILVLVLGGVVLLKTAHRAVPKPKEMKKPGYETAKAGIKKKRSPPATPRKPSISPRVAIVMDDFGYNRNHLASLFAIGQPVTLSILPGLPYSKKIAEEAASRGYEVILHLPLEPKNSDVREEVDTIRCGMSKEEIKSRLEREIASVPGLSGVSNHMGSKATEDLPLMTEVFRTLKKHGLYFSDSLTSQKSVCREAAAEAGIPYARRDIFLDNDNSMEAIEKQLALMKKMALRKGSVIAVCHDRPNTVKALSKTMPAMARTGIRFVKLSELVR